MRATVIKLVAFVAVCLAFTGWLATTIGNITPFQDTYALSATFDDVTGLLPNDNVKVAGVVVGKVRRVELVKGRARVTFAVRDEVTLPTDTQASIRWRNLLGQRYVYLYPGTAAARLASGDHISRTRAVVDLGELFNRLGPIVKVIDPKEVNAFLQSVTAALDGNEGALRTAIDDLARLSGALGSRDAAIGRLIENFDTVAGTITRRDAQIRSVLDDLLALATTFNDNTTVLEQAAVELTDFSDDLGRLLADNRGEIDRTVDNLTILVKVIQGKLGSIDSTVGGLDEAATKLFAVSRNGEWLNQVIPCGAVGGKGGIPYSPLPPGGCMPEPALGVATSGSAAVAQLMGQAAR
ncbi:MAG TPA: MCE family protein [Acidimicrobiales bacterium]|nr:MCE family protein [Acidimicrobiales bacterium]